MRDAGRGAWPACLAASPARSGVDPAPPRQPLGPLFDIAQQVHGRLHSLCRAAFDSFRPDDEPRARIHSA